MPKLLVKCWWNWLKESTTYEATVSTFAESNENCHPDDDDVKEGLESERREGVRVGGGRPHEDDPAEVIRNRFLEFPTSGRVEAAAVHVAKVVVAHAPEHKKRRW